MYLTLYFLLYYASLLLIGGIFISGWYKITRGKWYLNPDETPYWSGMIFSGWQRFWEQPGLPATEKFYYQGNELKKLLISIEPLIGFKNLYKFMDGDRCISILQGNKDYYVKNSHYAEIPLEYGTLIKEGTSQGEFYIFFFKEYPTYRFPKWVRSPLVSCIYCHGSIYGSLVWWISAIVFKNILHVPFDWYLFIIFWIPFLICQSFVAPFLNKQL